MADRFLMVTEEFPPEIGGVGRYAFELAYALHQQKRLVSVMHLTNKKPEINYPFPVMQFQPWERMPGMYPGDRWPFIQKCNTVLHHFITRFRVLAKKNDIAKKVLEEREKQSDFIVLNMVINRFSDFIPILYRHGFKVYQVYHGVELLIIRRLRKIQGVESCIEQNIFNSNATKSLYQSVIENKKKSEVIYPGLNFELLPKFDEYREQTAYIITICRLIKRKNVDIVIRAAAPILKNRDCKLVVVGDGPERERLQLLAESEGVRDKVLFTGVISEEEKYRWLHRADIFVLASTGLGGKDFEGFGIVYVEAAFYGCAVIGSRHGGAPEAVGDKGEIINFDNEDAEEMLRKEITLLFNDSDHLKKKQVALQKQAVNLYSMQKQIINI
jgi:glycosyltransferase involved in cell wall biosynthesis